MEALPVEKNGRTPVATTMVALAGNAGHSDVVSCLLEFVRLRRKTGRRQ